MEQAVLAATEKLDAELSSSDLMDTTFEASIRRLPDLRLDGILSTSQAKVWALMAPERNERGNNRGEDDPRLARYRAAEAKLKRAVEAGRIARAQANERLIGLRQRLWAEDAVVRRGDEAAGSENRARELAEVQLAAHTEQLGQLDARAAKRLELAAKGAVEQVLESQDTGQRADPINARGADVERAAIRIRAALVQGRITREQAGERLRAMRQRGSEARLRNATADITNHPLYQKTIKDVLSKEAYARYQARQAESLAFRQQAARDLVVASLDLQLWLGEKHRKRFEQAVAELPTPGTDDAIQTPAETLAKLHDHFSRTEGAVLSPWQTQQFETIRTAGNRRRGR